MEPVRIIFVFGSNRAGRHGKGAALYAKQKHGAIQGQGEGLQGESYAIPTKDEHLVSLSLAAIQQHVTKFLDFAWQNKGMQFAVTPIGCGLAGYRYEQIAPMFQHHPENVHLPTEFKKVTHR